MMLRTRDMSSSTSSTSERLTRAISGTAGAAVSESSWPSALRSLSSFASPTPLYTSEECRVRPYQLAFT